MRARARLTLAILVGCACWGGLSPGSAVAGGVTVDYTTTAHGGNYAPRNVVVAWVEDGTGAFVKTIGRWAATRKSHLVAWTAKAGGADADAVSGATRQDHTQTVKATWDLKNKAGNEVPDGTYTIRMELADSNSSLATQNDQGTYTLVKGATASTQTAAKSGGFTATIAFTPNVSATCNNGKLDAGETCDPPGSCPTSCAATGDACRPNVLTGSAAGCTAACVVQPITACANGDGCCPMGCDATTDNDCVAGAGGNEIMGGCAVGGPSPLPLAFVALLALGWRRGRRR